jgi:hypothetical protein
MKKGLIGEDVKADINRSATDRFVLPFLSFELRIKVHTRFRYQSGGEDR